MSTTVTPDSKAKEIVKKIRRIEMHARRAVLTQLSGGYLSSFRGRGIEFDEFKEYSPGEDIRLIDWNVTARLGQVYVKKFREERELLTMLMIDASASQLFGSSGQLKSDLGTEVAALLAFSAVWNQDKVGLILFTDKVEKYIPPKRGRAQAYRILREILSFKPKHQKTNISEALRFLNKMHFRHAMVFLISDFMSSNFYEALKLSVAKNELTGIRLSDPSEKKLPALGLIRLYDSESGEVFLHDSSAKNITQKLATKNAEIDLALQQQFLKAGGNLLSLSAGDPEALETTIRYFQEKKANKRQLLTLKSSTQTLESALGHSENLTKEVSQWWNLWSRFRTGKTK